MVLKQYRKDLFFFNHTADKSAATIFKMPIKPENVALEVYLEQDKATKTIRKITPDVSVRTIRAVEEVEKKYTGTAFPRTEATNVRAWAEWGKLDNLPNFIFNRLSTVPLVLQAIYKMAQDMYGNGIIYIKKSDFYEGNIQKAYDPKVEDFLRKNRIRTHWFIHQAVSRLLYWNAFTQFDLDLVTRSKIVKMYHLETPWSRLSKQNLQNNNEIEYFKYSGKFGSLEMPSDADITTYPLYRWYKDDFFDWLKGYTFVWHTRAVNMGATYYPRPFWIGLLNPKTWLDVAANVPRIVHALSDNQAVVKYVMKVSRDYFKFRYPDWEDYDDDKRAELIDAFEERIQNSLTGIDNMGKLITLYLAEENGQFVGTIEIEAIADKMKQDAWIPSSSAANTEMLNAVGFHASQMSLTNDGGSLGAGSGSDAFVHFNASVMRNTMEQIEILEPLQFAFDHNGWDYIVLIDNFNQTMAKNANGSPQLTQMLDEADKNNNKKPQPKTQK